MRRSRGVLKGAGVVRTSLRRAAAAGAVIVVAGCAAGGSSAEEPESVSVPVADTSTRSMTIVPFAEAEFVAVRPDLPNSPEIAVLWGDPTTGPSAMLMRLRRGSIPMHVHSSDYHLVVLEGTMKHWGRGETEATTPSLDRGSYWFQPGDLPHAEACQTETCLLHIVWTGRQDARLAS